MNNFTFKNNYRSIVEDNIKKDKALNSLVKTCKNNIQINNLETISKDLQPIIERCCNHAIACVTLGDKLMKNIKYKAQMVYVPSVRPTHEDRCKLLCKELIGKEELFFDLQSTLINRNANKIKHNVVEQQEKTTLSKKISIYNKFLRAIDNFLGVNCFKSLSLFDNKSNCVITKGRSSIKYTEGYETALVEILNVTPARITNHFLSSHTLDFFVRVKTSIPSKLCGKMHIVLWVSKTPNTNRNFSIARDSFKLEELNKEGTLKLSMKLGDFINKNPRYYLHITLEKRTGMFLIGRTIVPTKILTYEINDTY